MSSVTLQPITVENWKACAELKLAPGQERFIHNNLYSIAEAQFYPEARSRAIVNAEGELVGYALFGRDTFSGWWKVFRLMIDAAHQQRGYGKAAMHVILDEIAREPDVQKILICYRDTNDVARKLYAKLGFVEHETDETGRVTAVLKL